MEGQLTIEADHRLLNARRNQAAIDLMNGLRKLGGCERSRGRNGAGGRKEIRIRDHELLLRDAVEANRVERAVLGEAVVEDAEAGAHDGLGLSVFLGARSPRDSNAGSDIAA